MTVQLLNLKAKSFSNNLYIFILKNLQVNRFIDFSFLNVRTETLTQGLQIQRCLRAREVS